MRTDVHIDPRALKEISKFPHGVRIKIDAVVKILERDGKLIEPNAKKIDKELLEIRIKYQGQWRVLYAYSVKDRVILILAFQKKTQKLPQQYIKLAYKRLKEYTQ